MDNEKKMILLDGNLFIILAVILGISAVFGVFCLGYKIGKQDEKILSMEDVVFNNGIYPKINKLSTREV